MMEIRERQRSLGFEKRIFNRLHYEEMWSSYEVYQNIVKEEWLQWHYNKEESPAQAHKSMAQKSLARLILWSKEELGGREKKLKNLLKKLTQVEEHHDQLNRGSEIKNIEKQIQSILMEEEMYWKQRSKADWLKAVTRTQN